MSELQSVGETVIFKLALIQANRFKGTKPVQRQWPDPNNM